ncbi:MAG: ATP synthase F1 subunit gamma [Arcobacteraceae bacterium]|jgi:F-type H+-transporting ATPase subunit gamma|nr:ATP synthase F1 subunit gamma [Arcobacteraceae bacterium]
MANLKDISRQIKSVKNTQKTTKAMKLVSSAKLRRTQQLAQQAKSYASKINEILTEIASNLHNVKDDNLDLGRAFKRDGEIKVVDVVFVTADKGLCGGFNMTTIREVRNLLKDYSAKGIKVNLRAVGRKGIDYFNFQNVELLQKEIGLSSAPNYEKASHFISDVYEEFNDEQTDSVILVYNGFKNMLTQELKVKTLLPIDMEDVKVKVSNSMMEVEPEDDEQDVLDELVKKYIEFNIFYALIDSLSAEHSARMQAMDNATNNAKQKVNDLTVQFNKARQAAITTELIEIISGVEALK